MQNDDARFAMIKERHKKTFFEAVEIGRADKPAISLCTYIAGTKNFFTSSSCSGRIVLLEVNAKETKKEAAFHAKWHRKVKLQEIWKALLTNSKNELWFKMEPFILHIGTNNEENAQKLLRLTKDCGIKRGGIQVLQNGKIIFELTGTQHISCPAKKGKKVLLEKKYAKILVEKANKKFAKNHALLKKFEKECRKRLD